MEDMLKEQKSIFYTAIFEYCGSKLLQLSDFDLEGVIYEDFMFHYTDINDYLIDYLLKHNVLTKEIANKALKIRQLSDKVFSDDCEFSAKFIRQSVEWQTIFRLADEIQNELKLEL